jgi:hypothetical protein
MLIYRCCGPSSCRASHVQDVAKNANGGQNHSATNGVAIGHVENGRNHLSNVSNGLGHASHNGNQARQNGSAQGHVNGKPTPAANGNGVIGRPQSQNGINPYAGPRAGGKPANHGPNRASVGGDDARQPFAGPAMQSASGGGRGRDAGGSGGSYPNFGDAAGDNGVEGASAGRGKDPRRRAPRGRTGGEAVPPGAEPSFLGQGAGGSGGGAGPERPTGKPGRPRDRRPRSAVQEGAAANGNPVAEYNGMADANGARAAIDHDDAERGGQRSGRPRGRRGRGGQHAASVDALGGQDDEGQQRAAPSAHSGGADGSDVQQLDRPPRLPRQRPPKAPRPAPQNGAAEPHARDGGQAAPADGQLVPNGAGRQARKTREPRPPGQTQKPKPQDVERADKDVSAEAGGRGPGRGRGSRRRNGGGSDGGAAPVGNVEVSG